MGVSDESAILSKWLLDEGAPFRKGQPVFSLETDKATFQYEAESDGFLVRILTEEGEEVAVGSPVGVETDSEAFDESELEALLDSLKKPDMESSRTATETTISHGTGMEPEKVGFSVRKNADGRRRISPRARRAVDELGVSLHSICSGSGPEGRVIERDVLNAVHASQVLTGLKLKTTGICPGRPLTVADRVGIRPIGTAWTDRTGFVSGMFDARKVLSSCTPQNRLTPGVMVCHELAQLLVRVPELNSRRHGDRVYAYNTVHLRLNVETPFGTLKPVIRCAEDYTPEELAVLMRNAAGRCTRFASKPQEFQDGTFTVADLSGYGIDSFTPELTPPELCALGIGAAAIRTGNDGHGGFEAYPAIRLTLAYDRAGADSLCAAKFLNELMSRLERGAGNR